MAYRSRAKREVTCNMTKHWSNFLFSDGRKTTVEQQSSTRPLPLPPCALFSGRIEVAVDIAIMSIRSHAAARCCRHLVRPSTSALRLSSSTYLSQRTPSRRWQSTEAEGAAAPTNPKITQIVDQISQLNLMETADLVSSLKVRLRLLAIEIENLAY